MRYFRRKSCRELREIQELEAEHREAWLIDDRGEEECPDD